MKSLRIVLTGPFGLGDLGGEAILLSTFRGFSTRRPGSHFTVLSFDPGSHRALGLEARDARDLHAVGAAIAEADLLVVGGGELWQEYGQWNPGDLFAPELSHFTAYARGPLAAAAAGVPYVLFANGIGALPTPTARRAIGALASLACAVSVRDPSSADMLRVAGYAGPVRLAADPAFSMVPTADLIPPSRRPVRIGIVPCGGRHSADAGDVLSVVGDGVGGAARARAAEVVVVRLQHPVDAGDEHADVAVHRVTDALRLEPDAIRVVHPSTPEEAAGWLGSCDAVVTLRVHGTILAAVAGVPSVSVAVIPAMEADARELGLSDLTVPQESCSGPRVRQALEQALAGGALRTTVTRAVDTARELLDSAFDDALRCVEPRPAPAGRAGRDRERRRTPSSARGPDDLASPERGLRQLQDQLVEMAERSRLLSDSETRLRRELARVHAELQSMKDSKFWRVAKILAVLRFHARGLGFVLRHPLQGLRQGTGLRRLVAEVREDLLQLTPASIRRAARAVRRRVRRPVFRVRRSRIDATAHDAWYSSLFIRPALESDDIPRILGAPPPPARGRRADVVCFSIIDWDFRYQRPQQIMSQFAAQGHRVFYLSTSRFQELGSASRIAVRPIKENVHDVSLAATRPPQLYGEVVAGDNQAALLASLDELRRTYGIDEAIGYVMIASWGDVAIEARRRWGWRLAYDCMDEWENFPGIERGLLEAEVRLVGACDLLVVTAQRLADKWQKYDRPMVLARNAVDYQFYADRCRPNVVLSNVQHPTVGYYGAIADWFDIELMTYLARQRPQYTFVLLGGVFDMDVSALRSLPNVRLLGQQPYEHMPQYLYHFDACIIPFKLNPITEATDPVKLYEYLSGGKPVVSVALPELRPYHDLVYIATDPADFVAKLDAAVAEDDRELAARRRALARSHTWESRYRAIETGLVGIVHRVSLVIVTYNHLAVTRLCLESVLRNTEYPNYEIIIVDNDSIDGTPAYLRYLADRYPNVRIRLNPTNEGFARANNQGIALSRGDDIVLLNNDTIVPPGWLSRLVRHLRVPTIGLVGPVTNSVGNEAQIEVPYETWAEMEGFAAAYTWAHDGQVADIHMLAMFCVAFRRQTYDHVGPLDEQFGIGMFEDDDYTLRVRERGYRVVCAADVFVHHFGQTTFKDLIKRGDYQALFEANQRRYETKWKTRWVPHQHAPLRFAPLSPPAPGSSAPRT
jgi:GT2 family glycosyltransferase/polysaccharide pyruvyl transferase WcaK-like protein